MHTLRYALVTLVICVLTWPVLVGSSAAAGTADHWYLAVGTTGPSSVMGVSISMDPRAKDGYDGDPADGDLSMHIAPDAKGIFVLYYRAQGPDWTGATGFYGGDSELTPAAPGGAKTWYEFYAFAQNFTPTSANLGRIWPQFGLALAPPAGYRAHLVLDYVPASCNWTGGPDVWINDLSANNTFALPIPLVTDPLQGTQFHIDVYAPAVPEPSSLTALICGLAGVGGAVVRRRRNG